MTTPERDQDRPPPGGSSARLRAQLVALLERHRPALHAYAFALTGDLHVADDAVQEMAYIAAVQTDRIPTGADAAADWLRCVLRRKALELGRRNRRRQRQLDPGVVSLIDHDFDAVTAEAAVAHHRSLRQAMARCFARLSTHARRAVEARYLERRSCEQIAAQLDRRVEQIYSLLRRSRVKLGDCVRATMEGGDGR